jgi:hypothetical protein
MEQTTKNPAFNLLVAEIQHWLDDETIPQELKMGIFTQQLFQPPSSWIWQAPESLLALSEPGQQFLETSTKMLAFIRQHPLPPDTAKELMKKVCNDASQSEKLDNNPNPKN